MYRQYTCKCCYRHSSGSAPWRLSEAASCQSTGAEVLALNIYTSLGLKFFPSPVSEQSNVYLFADQHFESEGHFAWSAWWIEFTSRFKLTFKILRRNFFGRSLWGKGVEKPKRKNLCPAGVCNG